MTKFRFRINWGEERSIDIASSRYQEAACSSLGTQENVNYPAAILIWAPDLLPDYGPYWYFAKKDEFGNLVIGPARVLSETCEERDYIAQLRANSTRNRLVSPFAVPLPDTMKSPFRWQSYPPQPWLTKRPEKPNQDDGSGT